MHAPRPTGTARVTIDLAKITENARKTLAICRPFGLDVVGVTKGVCGMPEVARAMLAGGVTMLGDARLADIARMRDAGIDARMVLLRSPALSEAAECVALADASLNADLRVLNALAAEAARAGKRHEVVLMVDFDTGREGFAPEEVPDACTKVAAMKGLVLGGLGVYFAYRSEARVQEAAQTRLVALANGIERDRCLGLLVISGGSTNVFRDLTLAGKRVPGVNQLRLGTCILLGLASSMGPKRIQGFHHDTMMLDAELIEVKRRGRLLGILSLGHVDADPEYLFPVEPGVRLVRASSDHTIVDLTGAPVPPSVGDRVAFHLGYFAMNRLLGSRYVRVEFL